jgi:hypothetical protein
MNLSGEANGINMLDWRGENGYAQSELFLESEIEMIKQTNTVTKHMFFDYTIFTNMLLWQNQHGASSNNNEAFDHLRHWLNLSGHTKYVGWRKHHLYWFTSAIFVGNIHYWLNHAEAIQVQYRLVNLIPMEPIPWMKKGPPFQETSIFIMEFMKSMMG